MAINFKKPTFTTAVEVWKLQPDLASWLRADDDLVGQVYTQKRSPDNASDAGTYFVYPKEQDVLRDVIDYGAGGTSDVVVVSFPTGAARRVGYKVTCVEPRWLKFGNEHLMASLSKITPIQLLEVENPAPPPPPDPPPEGLQVNTNPGVFNGMCNACSIHSGFWSLNKINDDPPTWISVRGTSCYPPDTEVLRSVTYLDGVVIVEVSSGSGVIVRWEGDAPNWDFFTSVSCDKTVNTDGQCIWPFSVVVA